MTEQGMPLEYYVNVTLSQDKLVAYLHFTNCDETFTCTVAQLEDIVKNQHIIHGVNHEILAKIASTPVAYMLEKTIIATGDKPVDGKDGYIEYMYDLNGNEKRPLEREDGTVNYKEVTSINNVRKGQIIAKRIPPMDGTNGKAVTGEALFAKAGKEARFKLGKNVVTDTEQTAMYAAIDGVVVKTDRDKINVFPIYEVNGDVDFNVGNINFVGTVVIRGNVHPGFKVKASGDIRVTGGVEAAELEAEGSIEISAGILGQHKGFVKAGKNVKSSFIQDGTVEAGEDIVVSQSIMHSTIRAGKNVLCQGTKGLIVGGTIQAGDKVVARTVGNSMSTVTAIEVGVLPELRNELIQLRTQMRSQMDNLDKTEKALSLLDQMAAAGQLSPDKLAMRIKLGHTKKQAVDELAHLKERILEIEKTLEDTDKAKVMVGSMVYGGTKIVIGRYTKFVKDPTSRVCFKLDNGDIVATANF
ncbi:DUF342 domain-containing protein [Gorillibacterium sp. sgz5001074]|uniref:DUF342 domain-containing protein n=1 Tax=Gorillibacterium sp. sgz5001074 TaxID=3446695 RepID=UPI003F66E11F